MYLQQTKEFPLLMRLLHQGEDLCESAAHAAYYLCKGRAGYGTDFVFGTEILAVVPATSQARYLIWKCGRSLEDGYSDGAMWFEAPNKPSKAQFSKELAMLLMQDLKRLVTKINKAISYMADYRSCKEDIRLLRKAKTCILGCYYPIAQGFDTLLWEIEILNRPKNDGKAKVKV